MLSFSADVNQLEDPRQQWREEQQHMLKEYLVVANEDLAVSIQPFHMQSPGYFIS